MVEQRASFNVVGRVQKTCWLVGLGLTLANTWLSCCPSFATDTDPVDQATRLLRTGRYDEAIEAFEALGEEHAVDAAVGLARCHSNRGKDGEAKKILTAAAAGSGPSAAISAELALLAFDRGDFDAARSLVSESLKQNPSQLIARWIDAELHRLTGKLDLADRGYEWFIDYYNATDRFAADDYRWIGLAAARYARWHRNSGQFSFLVNTFYPDALQADRHFWLAHLESAKLFAEKYNENDAKSELDAALAINANAAEVYAVRAELALHSFHLRAAENAVKQALKINPRLLAAHLLKADIQLANLRPKEAIEGLQAARKINPVDEGLLGRLAAAWQAVDGPFDDSLDAAEDSPAGKLIVEVTERNKHCGDFFTAMGDSFDRMRKYPLAAKYYREAERRMPQLLYVRGQLGLVKMRLGEEAEAAKLLEQSFEMDPFNVRVKNMLEVLDVLQTYAVLETEHFIIRFDRGQDDVLAKYAARYLEEVVYPEIVTSLGYEPPDKSLFEFFSQAKNSSGHSWFSARMVGLPFIGTVGACAGKMVAMTSPTDMPKKFNWARVLKHEFVHVVNLQQTNFNIPHWYTEALAVRHEKMKRPNQWLQVLAVRAKSGDLFNLDTINLGFIRPKNQDDWTLAYCQAELYADFMASEFGEDALAKMLAAFAENIDTEAAIGRCFGIEQAEFERRYLKHIEKILADFEPGPRSADQRSLADLKQAVEKSPDDAGLQAEIAAAYLAARDLPRAREHALAAQAIDAKQPLAGYVLARISLVAGDKDRATELLEASFDAENPNRMTLELLAALRMKDNDFQAAEPLYRLAQQKFPGTDQWLKALSRIYLQNGDNEKLAGTLRQLAEEEYDNALISKKLAQLAIESQQFDEAIRWATRTIHIDVMDAETHALLAQTLRFRQRYDRAIEHFETALQIDSRHPEWSVMLAETCIDAEQPEKAKVLLEQLLKKQPDNAAAQRLLQQLKMP